MNKEQELLAVIRLGADMRQAQKTYFKTRSPANLEASKKAERAFDSAVSAALNPSLLEG